MTRDYYIYKSLQYDSKFFFIFHFIYLSKKRTGLYRTSGNRVVTKRNTSALVYEKYVNTGRRLTVSLFRNCGGPRRMIFTVNSDPAIRCSVVYWSRYWLSWAIGNVGYCCVRIDCFFVYCVFIFISYEKAQFF